MEKKEVIAKLLKEGAKQVENIKVKNATVTPCENYTRVAITLDGEVDGYITEDEGVTYKLGTTRVIYVSLYSLASLFRDDEETSAIVNHLIEHPKALTVLLNGATVTLIQEKVAKNSSYSNPFSENAEAKEFDHDGIITHVTKVTLGKLGKMAVNQILMAMLGI